MALKNKPYFLASLGIVVTIVSITFLPLVAILLQSLLPSEDIWEHLVATVLWDYLFITMSLMALVALF